MNDDTQDLNLTWDDRHLPMAYRLDFNRRNGTFALYGPGMRIHGAIQSRHLQQVCRQLGDDCDTSDWTDRDAERFLRMAETRTLEEITCRVV